MKLLMKITILLLVKLTILLNAANANDFDSCLRKVDIPEHQEANRKSIEFIAGPCQPVVLVPGIMGTKIQVKVTDCDLLKANHKEIYDSCFKNSCKKQTFTLWMNQQYLQKGNDCFSQILSLNLKMTTASGQEFKRNMIKGIIVTYYGDPIDDEGKKKDETCGLSSIKDIFTTDAILNIKENIASFKKETARGFKDLIAKLESLGYEAGINLFGLAYNWTEFIDSNENSRVFKETVNLAYELTGKPVLVIAHSMGGLLSLNEISQMTDKTKIARLVTIGTPYIGAAKSLKYSIFGTDEFNSRFLGFKGKVTEHIYFFNVYLSIENQRRLATSTLGNFQLMQTPFYQNNEKSPWYSLMMQRVKIEEKIEECVNQKILNHPCMEMEMDEACQREIDIDIEDNCIIKISNNNQNELNKFEKEFPFPKVTTDCNNRMQRDSSCSKPKLHGTEEACIKTIWDKKCRLNLEILNHSNPILKIDDKGFDMNGSSEIRRAFQKKFISKYSEHKNFIKWAINRTPSVSSKVPISGVPTTIIALTSYATEVKFDFDSLKEKQEYRIFNGGDGTVPNSSLLAPFLSWDSKQDLELVHMCTKMDSATPCNMKIDMKRYTQIGCNCQKVDEGCSHAGMLSDELLINQLLTYIKIKIEDRTKKAMEMRIEIGKTLNFEEKRCSNLKTWGVLEEINSKANLRLKLK